MNELRLFHSTPRMSGDHSKGFDGIVYYPDTCRDHQSRPPTEVSNRGYQPRPSVEAISRGHQSRQPTKSMVKVPSPSSSRSFHLLTNRQTALFFHFERQQIKYEIEHDDDYLLRQSRQLSAMPCARRERSVALITLPAAALGSLMTCCQLGAPENRMKAKDEIKE